MNERILIASEDKNNVSVESLEMPQMSSSSMSKLSYSKPLTFCKATRIARTTSKLHPSKTKSQKKKLYDIKNEANNKANTQFQLYKSLGYHNANMPVTEFEECFVISWPNGHNQQNCTYQHQLHLCHLSVFSLAGYIKRKGITFEQ